MHFTSKNLTIFCIIVFCILLTGCMLGPDFHQPAAPRTDSYTASPLPSKTISVPAAKNAGKAQYFVTAQTIPADWWTVFHSPTLNQFIQTGLANSPNLAAAQAALRLAQETLNVQTGALMLPSVSAQFSGERSRVANLNFDTLSDASTFNLYNASVGVSYLLDVFGASRRELESLRAQVDYQQFQLEAAYLTLAANIVTTAITSASIAAQIDATHQLIELESQQLKIVKTQFRLGGVSSADVYSQETELAQTQATLPPLEQNLSQSKHALAVLMGQLPSEAILTDFKLEQLQLPDHLPVTLPSALVQQRPDIRASEALLHAASAQIGVATANLFPQITLNASYGWQALVPSPAQLFQPARNIWGVGGSLLQPLFNGGSLLAAKRAAVDAYDQAAAQYYQTVLQAFKNVADVLRAIQHDAELLHDQQAATVAAHRTLQLTQEQFRLGGASFVNVLLAQRQYQQALIHRIQAQAARYNDTAALFQALGGGWWNRSAQHG